MCDLITMDFLESTKTNLQESIGFITPKCLREVLSSFNLRVSLTAQVLWPLIIGILFVILAYVAFHPLLKIILRPPLWKYLGVKFGDIEVTLYNLTVKVDHVELFPMKCSILRGIFVAIFPSANVSTQQLSDDYPESKITIDELTTTLRIGTAVGLHLNDTVSDVENLKENKLSVHWILRILYYLFPRPVIDVVMDGVILHVEKAYIAPDPPSELVIDGAHRSTASLPSSVVSSDKRSPYIPTFDQEYWMDFLRNDEVNDADNLTFCIERWIKHVVTKMRVKMNGSSDCMNSSDPRAVPKKERTDDEKTNFLLTAILEATFHSLSIRLNNAAVVVCGAGSEVVKSTREKYDFREANLQLAKLPRNKRALTSVGADLISISFTADTRCNLLFYFVGLSGKVGNPRPRKREVGSFTSGVEDDAGTQYDWRTITHPFQVVLEVVGVIPFVIWALNYDHYWRTRTIGLNITTSQVKVALEPNDLHTVFLHFDDFTDPKSPLTEWFCWLQKRHLEKLQLSDYQKSLYCESYARSKGVKYEENFNEGAHKLTLSQMRDLEKKMTRQDIIFLRCKAMKKKWRIPKENQEFVDFLGTSRSSIVEEGNNRLPSSNSIPLYQRQYSSPLEALTCLVRESNSFLSPIIAVNFYISSLDLIIPNDECSTKSIPSIISVMAVSSEFKASNPLFSDKYDLPREYITMNFSVCGLVWNIGDNGAEDIELSRFRNGSFVGLAYMCDCDDSTVNDVVTLDFRTTLYPSQDPVQTFSVNLEFCNVALILNPLPLLSSLNVLLALFGLPFRPVTETTRNLARKMSNVVEDASETNDYITHIRTDIQIRINDVSVLFMIDREQIYRGVLDFSISEVGINCRTDGLSGKLSILPQTLELCAAQVSRHQPNLRDGILLWKLMPLKPILTIDGARIDAIAVPETESSEPIMKRLQIDTKIGAESFAFNASPSAVVALIGIANSLEVLRRSNNSDAEETVHAQLERRKSYEEERNLIQYRRDALFRIFNSIDADESGTLQRDELDQAVLALFEDNSNDCSSEQRALTLTTDELRRETDFLRSVIDPKSSNAANFEAIDSLFFRMANKIDDNNLIPQSLAARNTGRLDYSKSKEFLSNLRSLVYFDDLREFAAMHEVYRITGCVLDNRANNFPVPSLWRYGQGIDLFWDLYSRETGCTPVSLNGQSITSVQRKLVRFLYNYNFAKFCWKSLVEPQLRAASSESGRFDVVTCWVLDEDSRCINNSGAIDRLLQQVYNVSNESRAKQATGIKPMIGQYNVSVSAVVDRAMLTFGSAHTFTKPLLYVEFFLVSMSSSARLSHGFEFVSERDNSGDQSSLGSDLQLDEREGNFIHFRSTLQVNYLNRKHDHMECLLEPYPCFGNMSYKVFFQDSNSNFEGDHKTSSFSVNVDCPRFLHCNALPAFFETASVLSKVISQSDPESYRKIMISRDIAFVRNIWNASIDDTSDLLSRREALSVLRSAAAIHWKGELEGLQGEERDKRLESLFSDVNEGPISFLDVKRGLRKSSSTRCYFSGCETVQLKNSVGRDLNVATKDVLDVGRAQGISLQTMLASFQNIGTGSISAIPLKEINDYDDSHPHKLIGRISLYCDGYKMIDDIGMSPYQPLMFPLVRRGKTNRHAGKRTKNASGFAPFLTVVPNSASLDSITLEIRSCVTIITEIPIKIRIVRLSRKLGYLRKRGTKSQIDLLKKNLGPALKRLAHGAVIVHERNVVKEGTSDPLPLDILDSSHYHVLLIQDLTTGNNDSWREPVLLTKDFLFNAMQSREISRCHSSSGILVLKDRLNIHMSTRHHNPLDVDTNKSILRRTAWDTTIKIVPFFLLSNSLPFPILIRSWQFSKNKDDEAWTEYIQYEERNDESYSSDDDTSSMTPSLRGRSSNSEQFHLPKEENFKSNHFSLDRVEKGGTLRLSGISLKQPIFIQVSQSVELPQEIEGEIMWSGTVKLGLDRLRTGVNRKGSLSLPKIVLDIGDNCDTLVDVSVEQGIGVPMCTIYSPYWLMNKTGMKLEYKILTGHFKRYMDSGVGGLPVMIHCGKSIETNKIHHNAAREVSLVPLERPSKSILQPWWDATSNGILVLQETAINNKNRHLVGWSEKIELDAAGTSGETHCKDLVLNVAIESLAGVFHRSNLVTVAPRYIVKNMLHIPITIIPLSGQMDDAIQKVNRLQKNVWECDGDPILDLDPGESTIIYHFHDLFSQGLEKRYRWVAFHVNASRLVENFRGKWHLVPVDAKRSTYYGEHDGIHGTMCGILESKVHSSDGGSIVVSIAHAPVPPFRIENRSSSHQIQFIQDDDDAVVFELPPMHSCAYTWDSPLGKKKLRAVVVPKATQVGSPNEKNKQDISVGETMSNTRDSEVNSSVESDTSDETLGLNDRGEPLLHSLKEGPYGVHEHETNSCTKSLGSSVFLKKGHNFMESSSWMRRRRLFGMHSRGYKMNKIGRMKNLPCPGPNWHETKKRNKMTSRLYAHTRILAGTKILSFSDSTFLAEQVELGLTRKGGDFKSALYDIKIEGVGFYIMDDFPREMIGVVLRGLEILKPRGSIETHAKVRHLQVDAMLPDARYPIIIQPLPLGVDRREDMHNADGIIQKHDCFWLDHDEKPVPIFEVAFSYVPQSNMIWIPNIDAYISPMKVQIDVDYLLRVAGTLLVSIGKTNNGGSPENIAAVTSANDKVKYITRGQMNICLTYIEKLNIAPVWFEVELDIKPDGADSTSSDTDSESALTLNTIARSTNSAVAAGVLMWVINVGSNFAHVSPTFSYTSIFDTDKYCDVFDLVKEIAIFYIVQTIKQSYKVIFSMHLLGDPSLLAYQYKTGVSDLIVKTRNEISSGCKDGFGRGFASFFQHVVGGTFFAAGKVSGGLAKTLDSVTSNEMTSNHLKPSLTAKQKYPRHAVDGVIKGTNFLGRTLIFGIAGLIGNPYRGAKHGVYGFAKGVASGMGGFVVSPFVGALGFIAKTSDGFGATTKYMELGYIEARCRPARLVPWGRPMCPSGLLYLKAIGIRVHTVKYQKIRKRVDRQEFNDSSDRMGETWQSAKEFKRLRAAEERRKNPPRKIVSIVYEKDKRHYTTYAIRPKLLSDHIGSQVLSHYAVTFEETLVLRSSDLQLKDEGKMQVAMDFLIISFIAFSKNCVYGQQLRFNSGITQFSRQAMRNHWLCVKSLLETSTSLSSISIEKSLHGRRRLSLRISPIIPQSCSAKYLMCFHQ